ncbi:CpsD/CapB family tyrosine-protein kinase [Phenylobacterium sp.]|uniref:CpsD/CapB family tyrosine-protein kinase n=1 Tax=Phenylobacterium sp. TaxID=1871053 RepID=UPI002ED7995B
MTRPPKAARAPKPPKARKVKPPKPPRGRKARPEGVWVTPEGYRLAQRLVALDPARPGGDIIVALAHEVVDRHVRLGRRGLAVCGAASGAGVTFVAANLAIALAQAGVSTLLVDANLEAPRLHELIAPPEPGPGLGDLLTDAELSLHDVVHSDVLPGLSVLYAGAGVPEGPDGLGSERFRALAERCLRDYDCTIFDTAPANRSTGARAVGLTTGYALLVARRNLSYAEDMGALTAQLNQDDVEIIGSVLNNA